MKITMRDDDIDDGAAAVLEWQFSGENLDGYSLAATPQDSSLQYDVALPPNSSPHSIRPICASASMPR